MWYNGDMQDLEAYVDAIKSGMGTTYKPADDGAVRRLARCRFAEDKLWEELEAMDSWVVDNKGRSEPVQQWSMCKQIGAQAKGLEVVLGLVPSARKQIHQIEEEPELDDFERSLA